MTSPKKRKRSERSIDFIYTRVVGPMVGASDLPFRLLCRAHGADVCYTEMLFSETFAESEDYRRDNLEMCKEDHPVVVQFCGNDPKVKKFITVPCCF